MFFTLWTIYLTCLFGGIIVVQVLVHILVHARVLKTACVEKLEKCKWWNVNKTWPSYWGERGCIILLESNVNNIQQECLWFCCTCKCTCLLFLSHRSPVKKKNLVQNDRALTPKQRMEQRKKQKADQEAEHRKRIAARNYSEGQVS